ncbi:DUF501 domain-containing protein [Candidatus Bipolaricaulota bacterium]|nr:DUF501 domain-containing protein [Candidatus Bipolaricaulota bacterium]
MESEALKDRKIVGQQIGRSPRGQFVVSVRCSYGYPQVIRVHPVVQGKPFPTLFWLTCPFLSNEIDHLEAGGWVKRLEARMIAESDLRAAMQSAHQRYCRQRDRLLSPGEIATLEADGTMVGLSERGIGGLSDWDRLKCLHLLLHPAFATSTAATSLKERSCLSVRRHLKQVICSAYE